MITLTSERQGETKRMRDMARALFSFCVPLALIAGCRPANSTEVTHRAEMTKRIYSSDEELLRGELARFRTSIDPGVGSSIYTAYNIGYPLARAILSAGQAETKRALVAHAAGLIESLPTLGTLMDDYPASGLSGSLGSVSSTLGEVGQRISPQARFDGLPLPRENGLRDVQIFPLEGADTLEINTGNIQQFGHYLSTVLRLGVQDEDVLSSSQAREDLRKIADYLVDDYLRFFWLEAPAWHWTGAFEGGVRARTIARLEDDPAFAARDFFRAFLDYDLHVLAVAADVRGARADGELDLRLSREDVALLDDLRAIAWRVLEQRVSKSEQGFGFDRGLWDDNPVADYGGCQSNSLPEAKCPIHDYTADISHAQRWPAWLDSFAAGEPSAARRARMARWREAFADRVAQNIKYDGEHVLLPNFLDGRDGWMLTTGSQGGNGAHPPSSMTGWAMRYGMVARIAEYDTRLAKAQRRFCATIVSRAEGDIAFRTRNYGEPEANPANGIRPLTDEYGLGSIYDHICRMEELASGAA